MSERTTPRPAIVPFLIGDLLLLAVAGGIVYQSNWPLTVPHMALCTAAVALGAWLLVMPFILEHRAARQLAEADALSSTVAQIKNLEQINRQIGDATGAWLNIQGECARTVQTAKEVADGMATEAKAFTEFLRQANDSEKATLRLEVDKLRRQEGEWLQITVRILDQIFALYRGAVQSGQPALIQQIGLFQNACLDAARRVGVAVVVAGAGEPFNRERHQVHEATGEPPPEARVAQTLLPGLNFQGRLLRPALVQLEAAPPAGEAGQEAEEDADADADALPEAPAPAAGNPEVALENPAAAEAAEPAPAKAPAKPPGAQPDLPI